ncbi:methyltransferase domain-containing protein [Clostridium brassicae]|uniref:Methyltransferase domain-containing protein n=1 Tax=Clostridium brassicae TaxID=2999072 RepID=A0ABT4DBB4_9CLOT|nr:methyltransferase domain-containing protein [Clostridium brassicae]MCY6959587.1 methyltransferase domain-containing protein [Clostridium brassicae]
MDKLKILNRIKELYLKDTNIIKYLKIMENNDYNSIEDIMISYDLQAGTYSDYYKKNPILKNKYCNYLADIINKLEEVNSLLEVGIGEATTLGPLMLALNKRPKNCYGFDVSWSRIKYAKRFLNELNLNEVELFTGDLFCAPFKDNSIDIVYTSHSVEPNGGKEREALEELYRITNKYLILLEPDYELADEKSQKRMIEHGYVTKLYSTAIELGYKVIEHRLFDICANQLNPTGLIIIEKESKQQVENPICCPITKTNMIRKNNAYYSPESLLAYPIIDDIPCLLSQNAIIATKFL